MGRKEVLAGRKALEDYYYNCKLETPEEVAKLFEVYTKLIWNYHQAGLVYDYYCDDTTIHNEGGSTMVGGVNVAYAHTIPAFSAYRNKESVFCDIFCVGDQENGYRFGQVTTHNGVFAKDGFSSAGVGDGKVFRAGDAWSFCQCVVNKVNGRWVVTEEYLAYGQEALRRRVAGARPFYQTILDGVAGPAAEPLPEEPLDPDCEREIEEEEVQE